MSRCALKGYRSIQAAGKIEGATPHRLTALLFEAALASIQTARRTEDGGARQRSIDRALAIVGELQGSLRDPERDPLSGQLHALYGFVQMQLLDANRLADDQGLQHAHATLLPLQEAWKEIGPDVDTASVVGLNVRERHEGPARTAARG